MSEENKNFSEEKIENESKQDDASSCNEEALSEEQVQIDNSSDIDMIGPVEEKKPAKKGKRISLKTFVVCAVALVLAAVMTTYSFCSNIYQKQLAEIYRGDNTGDNESTDSETLSPEASYTPFDVLDLILSHYYIGDVDKEEMINAALKAYIEATGDVYAQYYTKEELTTSNDESAGRMYGIGVNIINSTVIVDGVEYKVLKITNIFKNSPASEAGLRIGDMIAYTGNEPVYEASVTALGYDEALKLLKGEDQTKAEFMIFRADSEGNYSLVEEPIVATRREVKTSSVYSHVSTIDSNVGIVKITEFDLTTPTQFEEAVDSLIEDGCNKFVFDVRYNPGGRLISIRAVLSYFLSEGDVYIYTEDSSGKIAHKIETVSDLEGDEAGCNVSEEDIGKYKDLDMVVLCNEYTASAGELFTAAIKDYDLAPIIGTTTFGKGKMQRTIPLIYWGLEGAVKVTTSMYYPPSGEGYDGIGIIPDHIIELSEESKSYNIYDIPDDKDNQLVEAIKKLNQ